MLFIVKGRHLIAEDCVHRAMRELILAFVIRLRLGLSSVIQCHLLARLLVVFELGAEKRSW